MSQSPRIVLFGSPTLELGAEKQALALPPRAYTVLALLALRFERPMLRGQLAETLWPESTNDEARANLRRYLHLIVRALPPDADVFELTKNTARWNPHAKITCDVVDFLQAARDPARAESAAQRYGGELCAGVPDDALEPLRAELVAAHETLLRGLASTAMREGDTAAAVLALHQLLADDPLDESSARALITARLQSGDRASALREYHAFVARLRSELDVEPEPATAALFDRMLASEYLTSTPHNLTTPTSSLVGRAIELRTTVEALERDRLVTLLGPGGIGKTRLATEAALIALNRFPAGVTFVDLARERSAAAMVEQLATTLGVATGGDRLEAVLASLGHARVLLVLDNLEQLGTDARATIDRLIAETAVSIIATSRRRIGSASERVIAVSALQLPPVAPTKPEALAAYPAVRLFLERATKIAPSVRLTFANARSVTTIVRHLDGIPLAIELVASRANLLTIDGICKRLDDRATFASSTRSERHSTIDEAIAWSYELLSPVEQAVFRRIAVFADGCSVEALEDVCTSVASDIVSPISELVESSLITVVASGDAIRYRTFESTRDFAAAKLRERDEYETTAQRHADYYARLAERLSTDFTTEAEQALYAQCDADAANFEAALATSLESDVACAARLVSSLWRYWIFRGRAAAAESAIEGLQARTDWKTLPLAQRARVLQAAGMVARETRLLHAKPLLERALALFRECEDTGRELEVLTAIAAASFSAGDYAQAEAGFERCLELQAARGDVRAAAGTLANLAQLAWVRGDCEAALTTLDRAYESFRLTKNPRGIAHVFRSRSNVYGTMQRYLEAIEYAEQSIALYEELGEPARVAEALSVLCDQSAWFGRIGNALAAAARSLGILAEVKNDVFLANVLRSLIFAASRADEHADVLRIDTLLESVARRAGLVHDSLDGTTSSARERASAALSDATARIVAQAACALTEADALAIARTLAARHASLAIEPFALLAIGRK